LTESGFCGQICPERHVNSPSLLLPSIWAADVGREPLYCGCECRRISRHAYCVDVNCSRDIDGLDLSNVTRKLCAELRLRGAGTRTPRSKHRVSSVSSIMSGHHFSHPVESCGIRITMGRHPRSPVGRRGLRIISKCPKGPHITRAQTHPQTQTSPLNIILDNQ